MKSIVLLGLIFLSDFSHARRRVLITAFEPFMGRSNNGSQEVAALMPALSDPAIEYVTCTLPVEYDRASALAEECYRRMDPKPDMVISTGEGACTIQVETRAMNYDSVPGIADNAGEIRIDRPIDELGSPYTFLSLPAADMVCGIENPDQWQTPNASTWAGFFVCNNTAFRLSRVLRRENVPYGFIHLPRVDCKRETQATANTLNTMIRSGISSLESRVGPGGELPCEFALQELNTQISPLLSVREHVCRQKFRETVGELMNPPPIMGSGDVRQ